VTGPEVVRARRSGAGICGPSDVVHHGGVGYCPSCWASEAGDDGLWCGQGVACGDPWHTAGVRAAALDAAVEVWERSGTVLEDAVDAAVTAVLAAWPEAGGDGR
jgi:hypothetical protein